MHAPDRIQRADREVAGPPSNSSTLWPILTGGHPLALPHSFDAATGRQYDECFFNPAKVSFAQLNGVNAQRQVHSFDVFSNIGQSPCGIVPDSSSLFERFEILASLAYIEFSDEADLRQTLESNNLAGGAWLPVGRSGWHKQVRERLFHEIAASGLADKLLKAGLQKGARIFSICLSLCISALREGSDGKSVDDCVLESVSLFSASGLPDRAVVNCTPEGGSRRCGFHPWRGTERLI